MSQTPAEIAFVEAEKRIAEWEPGTPLRLGISDLEEIPPSIAKLKQLEEFSLVDRIYNDDGRLINIISAHTVSSLAPIAGFKNLTSIDCSGTQIETLEHIAGLKDLTSINCSGTQVETLEHIAGLKNLTSINCSSTQVETLEHIAGLKNLTSINCSSTQVETLEHIAELKNLTSINCSYTQVETLEHIAELKNLTSIYCSATQVTTLEHIAELKNLTSIYCSSTQVTTLEPVAGLKNLTSIDCSGTQVKTLEHIAGLKNLTSINCSSTQVATLEHVAGLKNLTSINCSQTQVETLEHIAELKNLTSINCSYTQVTTLEHIAGLKNLTSIDCSATQVTTLEHIAELKNLTSIDCSFTQFETLEHIAELKNLTSVDCSGTQITTLEHIAGLSKIKTLRCAGLVLDTLKPALEQPQLEYLNAFIVVVDGIPAELFQSYSNHLFALRAHMSDLGDNPIAMDEAKLLVLGNGRIGKTQICRVLQGENFDEKITSTHGIDVSQLPVPRQKTSRFNVWDFGGQDIYHGTHSLFMRNRAVFMLVWTPNSENEDTHEHEGMTFRNYKLTYWLEHVKQFGSENAPIVVVQTQIDDAKQITKLGSRDLKKIEEFNNLQRAKVSAKDKAGFGALKEQLSDAYKSLNQPLIGPGRAFVKKRLEEMRADRSTRLMEYEDFEALCETARQDYGPISDTDQLLRFLHDAGTVFHKDGAFNNRLIIDQSWALDAIYTVFNREACYQVLLAKGGRFTRQDLALLLWDKEGYSGNDQDVFIDFMVSCGICFSLDRHGYDHQDRSFIAPDLLPEKLLDGQVERIWGEDGVECEETKIDFAFLPPSLMRSIMSSIGGDAGHHGDYWRHGFLVFETNLHSHLFVEQKINKDNSGSLIVRTRKGNSAELMVRTLKKIKEITQRYGLPYQLDEKETLGFPTERPEMEDGKSVEKHAPTYGRPSDSPRRYFVSYAWSNEDNPDLEKRVDEWCERKRSQGVEIIRDKDTLNFGDSLSQFMEQLASGDGVYIFLSKKYLESVNPMNELYMLWSRSGGAFKKFREFSKIFVVDDLKVFDIDTPMIYAQYWDEEKTLQDEKVGKFAPHLIPLKTLEKYQKIREYSSCVKDVLSELSDHLHPRSISEFDDDDWK